MGDTATDEFLSYEELAKRLNVDKRTIRRDVERKRLPEPVRIGRCPRFRWPAVLASLEAQAKVSLPE